MDDLGATAAAGHPVRGQPLPGHRQAERRVSAPTSRAGRNARPRVKAYLKEKYTKPGNVFLGVVHRLDQPVSGVLLFARTSKAAARLAEQFREGTIEKVYWAVVEGEVATRRPARWRTGCARTRQAGRVEVVEPRTRGAPAGAAALSAARQPRRPDLAGAAAADGPHAPAARAARPPRPPIYGDAKYGSVHTFGQAIALHARALTFLHPIRYEPITLTAELPRAWRGRFAYLLQEGQAMNDACLTAMRDLIQEDVGDRGLRTDPAAQPDHRLCRRFRRRLPQPRRDAAAGGRHRHRLLHPARASRRGETDGPLGALFLARR